MLRLIMCLSIAALTMATHAQTPMKGTAPSSIPEAKGPETRLLSMCNVTPNSDGRSDNPEPLSAKVRSVPFKYYHGALIGLPLLTGGLLEYHEDKDFRKHLEKPFNDGSRKHYIEDYTRFLPFAVMVGMKISGVESRSTWKEMVIPYATSAAIMIGSVKLLKHGSDVKRPDGSDNRSFPSGHSATAFMGATILSKEYGHISPWITMGAYATATATGALRTAHSKHWMSDVMVGAGIGILSTEIGYYIGDLISGKRKKEKQDDEPFNPEGNGSFCHITTAFPMATGKYTSANHESLKVKGGGTVGLESAWFINPYIGVGGTANFSDLHLMNNDKGIDKQMMMATASAGIYLKYPISKRWDVGTKLTGGATFYKKLNSNEFSMPHKWGANLMTGIELGFRISQNMSARIFADYQTLPPLGEQRTYMHLVSPGISTGISF